MNDCYNANPISMRAALESLAAMPAEGRRIAVLGGMAELGPDAPEYHREVGALARGLGIGPIIGVGELARDYAPDEWAADPEAAVAIADELLGHGDAVLVKGSRSVGLERFTDGLLAQARAGGCLTLAQITGADLIDRGEVLIAGMAAMLITIFVGPRFIEYLRIKEFGQQIREEGPQEHHAKAGTPTMGGLIVFLGIAVPYLVLSDRDTESLAVFAVGLGCAGIGFADDVIKITKRRSLGLSARYKLLAQIALAVGLWYVATEEIGLETQIQSRVFGGELDVGPVAVRRLHLPGDRRRLERRQPHRRTRRAGRGLVRDRVPRLHRDHDHERSGEPGDPLRLPGRRVGRASSGSTPSRPRSSWATPARWGWGARSARSR